MSDTDLAADKMDEQFNVIDETANQIGNIDKSNDAESVEQAYEVENAGKSSKSEEKTEPDLFNIDQPIQYSSDDGSDVESQTTNQDKSEVAQARNSESNADSSSSTSDSDESEGEDSSDSESENPVNEDDDDEVNEGDNDEPIKSKNEILDSKVPSLPEDYTVDVNTNIQFIGTISGVVEKNLIITTAKSAEDKVLNEGTVICFEDRTPVGLLYEVFGRLQSPVYSVKFNTREEAEKFRERKGNKVYYVVPTAEFLSTHHIRKFKGSDASNCNDEELPEDEQEFSDDEKEAAAKRKKKRKKTRQITHTANSVENGPLNHSEDENELPEIKRQKQENSKPKPKPPGGVPISVKARLTSLPSKAKAPVQANNSAEQNNNVNPMVMMQQFMSMVQQASSSAAPQSTYDGSNNHYPPQYQQQPVQVNPHYNPQFNQPYHPQYNQNTQPNMQYSQQYTQQYHPSYNQQFNQQPASQHFSQFANPGVSYNQPVYSQSLPQPNITDSPSIYTGPQNGNSNTNTALLVAQLAAAITKTAQNSTANFQQGTEESFLPAKKNGNNHNFEKDEDYDPTI
ncbi:hypothetical protein PMKS-001313 [Pichia membranifaciens]|uniref:H/ACA ribonucleoprotein complex non-core subunit NAF1 n=1 Tax=Pichia membranifaciens TaxID=4926 RepID=A0A1Q2YEB2_9ASCO|nr:hypothetical protein PMKS-001313 [Pichia membranifaciens]